MAENAPISSTRVFTLVGLGLLIFLILPGGAAIWQWAHRAPVVTDEAFDRRDTFTATVTNAGMEGDIVVTLRISVQSGFGDSAGIPDPETVIHLKRGEARRVEFRPELTSGLVYTWRIDARRRDARDGP